MKNVWIGAALLLAACAQPKYAVVYDQDGRAHGISREELEARRAPPRPPTAQQQGCSSGYAAGGSWQHHFVKDTTQYLADPVYKSNWDDGFALCKGEFEGIMRALAR